MRRERGVAVLLELLRDGPKVLDKRLLLVALRPALVPGVGPKLPLHPLIRVGEHIRPVQHREHARPGGERRLERVAVLFRDQTDGYGYVRRVLAALLVVADVHRHEGLVDVVDHEEGVGTRGLRVIRLIGERAPSAVEDEDGGAGAGRFRDDVAGGLMRRGGGEEGRVSGRSGFFLPGRVRLVRSREWTRGGGAGWAGTHEGLAAGPVRRVDRRGVRESSAAMGVGKGRGQARFAGSDLASSDLGWERRGGRGGVGTRT